ncbi:hypothetical protein [Treponema phagedenis]|uniref:Uncharacterized protein n=1 Tax=Treponema phagedenis TaxID=162 RepID=A0AAE6M830_TREPH|nr:hypothetical protein [Treponema phagedenis]EFW38804.1 hypothetical protein HMPREF9554_00693 [Treponema phagedenis F0421]QEJ99163.1 hypothetical protein FUT82_14950 [Treponema phagedenis]TYT76410.1 hypothetical protein FS559_15500 [Treponema phagedenis]TYT76576.1 hypothetical protein FS559_14040 [Treponema phagedenis]TYT76748.1 hypothetical protein FS559_15080 [Treponema phagedenis]
MGFETLIIAAKDWGPTAVTTIIAFVISYLFKQQMKNAAEDAARSDEFKKNLANGLNRLEENFNKNVSELKHKIEKQQNEIDTLKLEKLEREDFYKDMGGWRAEINRLQDLVINQNNSTLQKIIELWQSQNKK